MIRNLFNVARTLELGFAVVLSVGASATAARAQDHTGHTGHPTQGQTADVPYDLHYIDMTLAHHEQGVEMARLAEQKAQNAQVKAFARKTGADQERDTKELQRYRDTWYAGRPQANHTQMAAHAQSMPGHQGMQMDHGADVEKLRSASGAAFDRLFLDTMTHHHRMAVGMSKDAATKAEKSAAFSYHTALEARAKELAGRFKEETGREAHPLLSAWEAGLVASTYGTMGTHSRYRWEKKLARVEVEAAVTDRSTSTAGGRVSHPSLGEWKAKNMTATSRDPAMKFQ